MNNPRVYMVMILLGSIFLIAGCSTTYYTVWEQLGKEKRHLLKDNVESARDEQEQASEQFKDALTQIKELYGFEGGDLEDFYNRLKDNYEDCQTRAETVEDRIAKVEQIAEDLFIEWENEINEITNASFKAKSRASLKDTKRRYARLHAAMKKAQQSMDPVLTNLKDYVLYLKHNLNAQAIGALRAEVRDIELDIQTLIADMNKSIQEADEFLKNFQ
jgi:gas vesicle protein